MAGIGEQMGRGLIPPGISKSLRWRLVVSASIATLFLFCAWGFGMFTGMGFPGYARADDLRHVDQRLVNLETNQLTALRITLAGEVCRLHFLRMAAAGDVWIQLNKSFEDRQEEYARANGGVRYNVVECSMPR